MTSIEILQLPLEGEFAGKTVRDYLVDLLMRLWVEGECFNSKRPLGNSDWEYDIYTALLRAEAVEGKFDEYGYIEELDTAAADRHVRAAIEALR